ncbi:uncharacterized protein [Dermacentor albipictus]|uniref:uncharacterized protein isoform X2 n=1 Tax=Dermacentor albipictus TaxID=60249 RepID=UPI0038FC1BB0
MPDHGRGRVHRFRDHVVAGVNWRPTRFVDEGPSSRSLEGSFQQCPLYQVQFEEAECEGYEFPTRTANTVKVHCWNEAHGCEYTGTMDRMLEHYENECTFHIVECFRCGEGVQYKDMPTHYAAGCSAGVSAAITESSEHTALTLAAVNAALAAVNAALADVKATLGCLNHDQLLPVIQSQLNERTEQVRNQQTRFGEITRELGACEHNLKAEMAQITAATSSPVSHKRTSQQNPLEEASTSRSQSFHSGQDLILGKLERLAHLENGEETFPKPDFGRVVARWETLYGSFRHLMSALSALTSIKRIGCMEYWLTLENCEEIIACHGRKKKFAEIKVWHMRDTYFTIEVWKDCVALESHLLVQIEFNGTLVDSKCWPPFWSVHAVDQEDAFNQSSLTPGRKNCLCKRDDPSLLHFHLKFATSIVSLEIDGYLRDGKMAFHILLSSTDLNGGIRGAP